MRLKEGVISFGPRAPKGIGKPILHAMHVINDIMEESGEYCVTSLCDGVHGPNSLHYVGLAMDLRTRHLKEMEAVNVLARRLQEELGRMYQVIVEKDHIHLEVSDLWLSANGDPRKVV
jgi:hypothetical protein